MAVKAVLKENAYGNKVRVRTGKVRLSFPKLFEKDDKSGKYQCALIIPKDSDTEKVLTSAVKNAKEDGRERVWGGKMPGKCKVWITDGDEPDANGDVRPEYEGCVIINAKSDVKPPVYDTDGGELFDMEEIYAGCYVQAIFEAFPYNNNGAGISFTLRGVKKIADGERLSGGGYKAGADDFDEVDGDDEEEF